MAGVGKSSRALLVAAAALVTMVGATMIGCAAQVVDEPGSQEPAADEATDSLVDGTIVGPGTLDPADEEEDEVADPEPHPWVPPSTRERSETDPEPHPWHAATGAQGSPSSSESGTNK